MTETTNYLVTAANSGIGNGIAKILLARPNTKVVVCCRKKDPDFSWKAVGIEGYMDDIEQDLGNDSCEPMEKFFKRMPEGFKLDYVIACHGIATQFKRADQTPRSAVSEHVNVNVNGVLRCFQGFRGIMKPGGKFVAISSSMGSMTEMEPVPGLAYGISKAGLNFLIRKIHFENPEVTSVAIHPGWVKTKMGQAAADAWQVKEPPLELDESVNAVVKLLDDMTHENSGGRFLSYDGKEIAW